MSRPTLKEKKGTVFNPLFDFLKSSIFHGVLIGIGTYIIIFGIMILALSPEQYDLNIGDIIEEPIKAPRDVEDKLLTQEKIEQAKAKVPSVYRLDEQITDDAIKDIYNMFDSIQLIRYKVDELQKQAAEKAASQVDADGESNGTGSQTESSAQLDEDIDSDIEKFNKQELLNANFLDELSQELPMQLSKEDIITCIEAEHAELELLQQELIDIVEDILEPGIKQENIYEARNALRDSVRNIPISNELKILGGNIGANVIKPNMLYDHKATEAEKEKTATMVERVIYKKGQYIVQAGEPITENQLEVLKELGIVKDDTIDMSFTVGIGLVIFIILLLTSLYFVHFERELAKSPLSLLMVSAIICLVLLLSYAMSHLNIYMVPTAMAGMLLAILLKPELAAIVNISIAILVSILLDSNLGIGIMSLCGGMMGIYIVKGSQQRNDIVLAGIGAGLINFLSIIGVDLMGTGTIRSTLQPALWGFGGGVLSAIFTIGTLPIWENLFKIITPLKLVELSNPNQPVLKRLLIEAPGTYHHSVLVANLAENAADAIGANDLLARVGAYYHDIGKLKRPYFFKENQLSNDNPHDKLNPTLSTHIITMHTKDGVDIAQKYKVPEKICDFINEHHGTTPVLYFYYKAKEIDENIKLDDFRYSGPKPQSKESAIVMMADTVEAAVRSLSGPTPAKIEELIRKLIGEKLEDGQFDECPITLSDLDVIAKAFTAVVTGIFHERIEYPDIDLKEEREHGH